MADHFEDAIKLVINDFHARYRPCILRRHEYDVKVEYEDFGLSVYETRSPKGPVRVFRAELCTKLKTWSISCPETNFFKSCRAEDGIGGAARILTAASLVIDDEHELWGSITNKLISYDQFMKLAKVSREDIIKALNSGLIEFCIKVEKGKSVFVYDSESVPGACDGYDLVNKKYYKSFRNMFYGPELNKKIRHLLIRDDEARQVIESGSVFVSRFSHAYDFVTDIFPDDSTGRFSPVASPIFEYQNNSDSRKAYFYGVNRSDVVHIFNESNGYTPIPIELEIFKVDIYIRGKALRKFIRSAAYESIFNRRLSKYRLFTEVNKRTDPIRRDIEGAILDMKGDGFYHPRHINTDRLFKYLSKYEGNKNTSIISVDSVAMTIRWSDPRGEHLMDLEGFEKRLYRIRNEMLDVIPNFSDFFDRLDLYS